MITIIIIPLKNTLSLDQHSSFACRQKFAQLAASQLERLRLLYIRIHPHPPQKHLEP